MERAWLGKTRAIHQLAVGLAVGITIVMLVLAWLEPAPLLRLENTFLDFRFKLRGERRPGHEVVVVAVDEKSLNELGRWPWSRDKQAKLVDAISADGAKVIGLDIIYAEPEITEHFRSLQTILATAETAGAASPDLRAILQQRLAMADTDRRLAESMRAAGNVVLALSLVVPESDRARQHEDLRVAVPDYVKQHQFMLVKDVSSGETLSPHRATDLHPPLQAFAEAAVSLGHVYSLPDRDGITRYEYVALRYGGDQDYYPSLGLEVARVYLGIPRERMSLTLGEGVRLGEILVPTDQKAGMLINYAGPERSVEYASATDVIHKRVSPGLFRDRAVLVGTTALGTYDQKTTPFSANFPGVEKNAMVVDNIIHGQFLEKGDWSGPLDRSMILLFGLALGYLLPRVRALPGAFLALSAILGYGAVAQYLFARHGVGLDVLYPLLTIVLVFISITVLRFMTEEKQAREIRTMFSSYVSPRIVEELIKDPAKARLGGQRKELTMLFSDVAGFTTISEKHSAEEVVAQLNEYLAAMTEVIFRWNGTLDKFVGDSIVVFWGAPLDQPNQVELAIKCALHMRKRMGELQEKWRAEGKILFDNGIGINTGVVVVGNIGAEGKKMDYTMIGDHVNLAARVEGLTRQFAYPIVITEFTAERLKEMIKAEDRSDNQGRLGHVALRKLGAIKLKGKDQAVVAYGLESLEREESSLVIEESPLETVEMTEK